MEEWWYQTIQVKQWVSPAEMWSPLTYLIIDYYAMVRVNLNRVTGSCNHGRVVARWNLRGAMLCLFHLGIGPSEDQFVFAVVDHLREIMEIWTDCDMSWEGSVITEKCITTKARGHWMEIQAWAHHLIIYLIIFSKEHCCKLYYSGYPK